MTEDGLQEPVSFVFDPRPEPPPKPAGVQQGWFVIWNGSPGPALVAKSGLLTEDDGTTHIVMMEDFGDCTVIDDGDD